MTTSPTGIERRMALRLLSHWRSVRPDDGIPSLQAVSTPGLDADWPSLFVLRRPPAGGEAIVGRIGDVFREELPQGLVGSPVSRVPTRTLLHQALGYWEDVAEKAVPITMGGEYRDARDRRVLYRSIILPLSDDGASVDFLLGGASAKVVD